MSASHVHYIEETHWPRLRDIFLVDYPKHIIAYRVMQHYIDIKSRNPEYFVNIISLNKNCSNGTILTFDGFHIQVCSIDRTGQSLQELVKQIPLFMGVRFCSIPDYLYPRVKNALSSRCLDDVTSISKSCFYWLPKEEAISWDLQIPINTYFAPLKVSHADRINSVWPHKFKLSQEPSFTGPHWGHQDGTEVTSAKTSKDWITDMIKYSQTLGLFHEDTDELMCWVMLLHNDGLGSLQTEEKHMRKGYGRFIVQAMAKQLALQGKDTFAFVVADNMKSINLFEGLKFERPFEYNYWIDVLQYNVSRDKELLHNFKKFGCQTLLDMAPLPNIYCVPENDWPQLRDVFLVDYPKHIIAYRTVQHYIDIKKKNSKYFIKILSYDENWENGGTLATFDGYMVQVYTLEESGEKLQSLIMKIPLFMGIKLCCIPENLTPFVEKALAKRNVEWRNDKTHMYWFAKERAENFRFEELNDAYLAPLKETHAERINSLWPHRYELSQEHYLHGPRYGNQDGHQPNTPKTSKDWIKDMIQNSESLGVYSKSNDELMSWVMILHNDGLCALQTEEKHFRKGYGRFIVKAISKKFASQGKDTFCFIIIDNEKSTKLFESLGFIRLHSNLSWLEVHPYNINIDKDLLSNLFD